MTDIRTAQPDELAEMLAFERDYTENDVSLSEFRETYEDYPDLFVVCVDGDNGEDGDQELVGEASGYLKDDAVVLESIAVKNHRQGEGLGKAVLEFFEEQAKEYAEKVSVASADNVEAFYRNCGYEPGKLLLQVNESDLPEGYESDDRLLGERAVDSGTRFLYVGFADEEYDPTLRSQLKERFGAFEANTIYEKELRD